MRSLTSQAVRQLLPRRSADSHKGDFGHVLVVAGSRDMTGAAYLSALGALRSGAGLVTVASAPEARAVIRNRLPEAMTIGFSDVLPYIRKRRIHTLAIGPGLGVGRSQRALIKRLMDPGLRNAGMTGIILDADGLNNFSLKELINLLSVSPAIRKPGSIVITPHEGELARLTEQSRQSIHRNREKIAQSTAKAFGGVCLLKGHHTVIADPDSIRINTTGTPAMATGGMGDVLTGIIAGLLAQGLSAFDAACVGAWAHGRAGEKAARSDRGLLAHEVADTIPVVLHR